MYLSDTLNAPKDDPVLPKHNISTSGISSSLKPSDMGSVSVAISFTIKKMLLISSLLLIFSLLIYH